MEINLTDTPTVTSILYSDKKISQEYIVTEETNKDPTFQEYLKENDITFEKREITIDGKSTNIIAISTEAEESQVIKLSEAHERFLNNNKGTAQTLMNGCSCYFCNMLYPMIQNTERLLRELLILWDLEHPEMGIVVDKKISANYL